MPIIRRFATCVLRINPDDHNPPHFHVVLRDGREAMVEIASLRVLRGGVPARLIAEALDWAAEHREMLLAKWKELNP